MEKNKKNLFKKGLSLVLAGTMAATFAGCGKKESLLEDTVLENGFVVYVDDEPLIMNYVTSKNSCDLKARCNGKHYRDIITGSYYHVQNDGVSISNIDITCGWNTINSLPAGTRVKTITNYLTAEEVKKANEGTFTDDDVFEIRQRIIK